MTIFAYCRVSSLDQNHEMQIDAIRAVYPEAIIREEKASATSRDGRPVLSLIMDMMGKGDKLVVWKLDRLARNMGDLMDIVRQLEGKGATVEVLDQRIDTATASGKAFLQMLGVFAEFETNLRKERQLAGIERAKKKGVYKGRPASIDAEKIKHLKEQGVGVSEIVKRTGVSRASVYRVLGQA